MRLIRRNTTVIVAAALLAGGIAAPAVAAAGDGDRGRGGSNSGSDRSHGNRDGDRLDAIGLSNGGTKLVSFRTTEAGGARTIGTVTGLSGDTYLVGIDYRVQNGKLYGVGNAGGIYLLDTKNAKATRVGDLDVALEGTNFGVDFNPAANALRVVSDTGQNLRQPFAAGDANLPEDPTVPDGRLSYPPAPAVATGVSGAAYTNNDLNADTGTVLHDIDTMMDQLVIQSPANAGTLALVGKLRADAGADAGFDIYSTVRDGRSVAAQGWATLTIGGSSRIFSVNLTTGQATDRGTFRTSVTDIAIGLDQL